MCVPDVVKFKNGNKKNEYGLAWGNFIPAYATDPMLILYPSTLRVPYWQKIYFFIICFYAIMHRTTIEQNKIISIICSFFFFCPANIYRPSLGKLQLGKPKVYRLRQVDARYSMNSNTAETLLKM